MQVRARFHDGKIFVRCPACGIEQELKQNHPKSTTNRDGYDIGRDGSVSPVWICMARVNGAYCMQESLLKITNW